MTTITTRAGKGSALTFTEMDNNLTNLNTNKLEAANLTTYTGNITADNINAAVIGNVGTQLYGGIQDGNQGGITDVGTLNSLDVFGQINAMANVDVTNTLTASAISVSDNLSAYNATVNNDLTVVNNLVAEVLTVNTSITATGVSSVISAATIGDGTGGVEANTLTVNTATSANANITNTLTAATAQLTTLTANTATAANATVTNTLTAESASLKRYSETVVAQGNVSGTFTPNLATGTVHTLTLTGNITFNQFTNPVSGQSGVFVLTQDATGSRLLTSNMRFSGNSRTLTTTANAVDILSVAYIGTTYYAALTKGYL